MALSDRAADNLRFIRDTMARAGAFTSVSGSGMIAAGALGLATSVAAPPLVLASDPRRFLAVWIATAVLAPGGRPMTAEQLDARAQLAHQRKPCGRWSARGRDAGTHDISAVA